ncbi:hypothetical protein ACH5RR_032123 [Cinchona calisaya]|uniref:R13L1/DRL21-like LRR repeat region domain-containing protein n=1 Tax=Cinchona calisaya TaxID=153742 RepID=A0ABD2YJ60_9GENT
MPSELGQLACLRTLPFSNLGENKGQKIEELRNLKYLSGRLEIGNLGLVNDKEGAECANLSEKPNIHELTFAWCENRRDQSRDNGVLEGLKPHPNLKGLIVNNFMGNQLSSWISELRNLVKLKLSNCRRCKEIPALGHLLFLQHLELVGLDDITSIGPSFYGYDNTDGSSNNSGSGQVVVKLFRALKCLVLNDMANLIEWMGFEADMMAPIAPVVVFPILEELIIHRCPKLTTVPSQFTSLKKLEINYVNHGLQVLTKICSKVITLTHLLLNTVQGLTSLPEWLLHNNTNLTKLSLFNCLDLEYVVSHNRDFSACFQTLEIHSRVLMSHNTDGLGSLESLYILRCPKLKSIQIQSRYLISLQHLIISECDGLIHLSTDIIMSSTSLDRFEVSKCSNLISFPINLEQTHSLSFLRLSECVKLANIPKGICCLTNLWHLEIGPFSNSLDFNSFRDVFNGLEQLSKSLLRLHLYGWPHWESLPDQLQHLSALQEFKLSDFGVISLPDWFGKLFSLEKLCVYRCEKLEYLPTEIAMRRLTKLSQLYIVDCPLLKERCRTQSDSNPEWCKISRIPEIMIPGVQIERKYF